MYYYQPVSSGSFHWSAGVGRRLWFVITGSPVLIASSSNSYASFMILFPSDFCNRIGEHLPGRGETGVDIGLSI